MFVLCGLFAAFISGCATATRGPVVSTVRPPAAAPASKPPEPKQPQAVVATTSGAIAAAANPTVEPEPPAVPVEPKPADGIPPPEVKLQHASIVGSQESSVLFDNFTAFITAVDGAKVAAGREGWNSPVEIETGHRTFDVEFNRGVFRAKGRVQFDAVANAHYQLKFTTDTQLFGNNSFCNFWVVDADSGKTVSLISKDSVEKIAETGR
jgi:hypothetical protein